MKKVFVLAALAVAAVGCTNDSDNLKENNPATAGYIGFGSVVNVETRAGAVIGKVIPKDEAIGIYGMAVPGKVKPSWLAAADFEAKPLLFKNQKATSDGSNAITYSPLKTYNTEKDSTYAFFAYYPYTATETTAGNADGIIPSDKDVAPKLQVTLATTPAKQNDYMYATPIDEFFHAAPAEPGKIKPTDPQHFVFRHALTQVRFKFKNTEESNNVALRSIKVKGLSQGTMDITNGKWTGTKTEGTYTVYEPTSPTIVPFLPQSGAKGDENILLIQEGTGDKKADIRLMLFPLTADEMKDNATTTKLTFEITVDEYNGTTSAALTKTATLKPILPTGGLVAGSSYLYTLLYSKVAKDFITFTAEVTEWVDATGGDLPTTPTE